MSDVKYDSVLVGYAEEPRLTEDGQMMGVGVRFKAHELVEMAEKYATPINEQGQGGNVYLTLFPAKSGKWCCRCFDYNSEAAKEKRAKKEAATMASDEMPF